MVGGRLTTVWTESITHHASWTTTDHVGARESRILHARGKWMTAAVVDGAATNVDAGDTVATVPFWTRAAHSRTLLAIMSRSNFGFHIFNGEHCWKQFFVYKNYLNIAARFSKIDLV